MKKALVIAIMAVLLVGCGDTRPEMNEIFGNGKARIIVVDGKRYILKHHRGNLYLLTPVAEEKQ